MLWHLWELNEMQILRHVGLIYLSSWHWSGNYLSHYLTVLHTCLLQRYLSIRAENNRQATASNLTDDYFVFMLQPGPFNACRNDTRHRIHSEMSHAASGSTESALSPCTHSATVYYVKTPFILMSTAPFQSMYASIIASLDYWT